MLSYYQERCPQETSWLLPETYKYKLLLANMTTIILLRPLRLFPNTGNTKKQKKTAQQITKNSNKNSEPRLHDPSTGIQSCTKPLRLVFITTQQQKNNNNNNILNHIAVFQLLATQKQQSTTTTITTTTVQ